MLSQQGEELISLSVTRAVTRPNHIARRETFDYRVASDPRVLRERDRCFDNALELPHVARPVVFLERLQRTG